MSNKIDQKLARLMPSFLLSQIQTETIRVRLDISKVLPKKALTSEKKINDERLKSQICSKVSSAVSHQRLELNKSLAKRWCPDKECT